MNNLQVSFFTLGCKVNYCETENLRELFCQAGYHPVEFDKKADVCIINTCTVTHLADRKSRQIIRKARRNSPQAVVVVAGCLAQVSPEKVQDIPGVDIIIGTRDRHHLPQIIAEKINKQQADQNDSCYELVKKYDDQPAFERLAAGIVRERTRAFIKIQDGCDKCCSYCVVPLARGPSRSAAMPDILEEISEIAAKGCREIVFTGIHLGMYQDPLSQAGLDILLSKTEDINGNFRIRLSSIEPADFTNSLINTIASSPKVCPHLHIPLQSGSDLVLTRMSRPYNKEEYQKIVEKLRDRIPDVAISTDIIVGFPGESEAEHRETCALIKAVGFSRLHIFKYSPRPGTLAASYPNQVDPQIKERRFKEIYRIGKELADDYRRRFLGTVQDVLIEKKSAAGNLFMEGFSGNYIRVTAAVPPDDTDWGGKIVKIKLEHISGDLVKGFLCTEP